MHLAYQKFHTWSTPFFKKNLGLPHGLPLTPALLSPWKSKLTLLFGYLYLLLSFSLLLGFTRLPSYLLLLLHTLHSITFDNPYLTHTQGAFDTKLRACLFDLCLFAALLMLSSFEQKGVDGEKGKEE